MEKSMLRVLITSGALLLSSCMVAAGAFVAAIDSASNSLEGASDGGQPTLVLKGGNSRVEPLSTMVSPSSTPDAEQPKLAEDLQASLIGAPCLVKDVGAGKYAWVKSTQITDLHDVYFVACLVAKK